MPFPWSAIFTAAWLALLLQAGAARADDRSPEDVKEAEAVETPHAIVAPVKRVSPRMPDLAGGEPSPRPAANGSSKPRASIVPARPNCDPGYVVSGDGKTCSKAASRRAQHAAKIHKAHAGKKAKSKKRKH